MALSVIFGRPYTGVVNTYADLPSPEGRNNQLWLVKTSTGIIMINYHPSGTYYSDGTAWFHVGGLDDLDMLGDLAFLDTITVSYITDFTTSVLAIAQPLDGDLTAIAALSSTGIAVRTTTDTWALRTITGTADEVEVTNGNGVSGNPIIGLPKDVTISDSLTVSNIATISNGLQINGTLGGYLRTGTGAGNSISLQARDVDGAAYTTFITLTANNTPTCALSGCSFASGSITGSTFDNGAIGSITPSTGIFTQLDVDNLRLDGNTLSSTNTDGAIILDPNGTGAIQLTAPTEMGLNSLKFGASNEASITYDGTAVVFNPKVSGTGTVVIGSGSGSGLNDANLLCNKFAVGGSDILGTSAINCSVTGSLRAAMNFVLTQTTGAISAPLTVKVNDQSTATSFISTSVFEYRCESDSHSAATGVQATVISANTGIISTNTMTVGTDHSFTCLKLNQFPSGTVGGSHTVNIYATALFQKRASAITTSGTQTVTGAYFGDDVLLETGTKLYFEASETSSTTWVKPVKGDSYIYYASSEVQHFADGVQAFGLTSTAVKSYLDLTIADNIGAQFGTGIDTEITYTGTVWDFNILQATTEIVFNNAGFDTDFRIESDTDTDMFFVNAGTNRVGISTTAPTKTFGVDGDIALETAGNGLYIKEGTNATMGTATLVGGTVVVNTTKVTANSRIFLTNNGNAGTVGSLYISARTAGTSFTVTSTNILDTSTVDWLILEPA